MKKIAFFDIDGTLINVPAGLMGPTEETRKAMKAFQSQGNYIVVASARGQLPDTLKDMEFDGEIYSDGHYISFQGEVLLDNVFTPEQVKMQLEIYKKYNGECLLGGYHGAWISTHTDPYVAHHSYLFSGSDDLTSIPLLTDENIHKAKANTITAVFGTPKALHAAAAELPNDWEFHAYDDPSSSIRMDVHLPGYTKGTACEFLYKHLNFNKADTIAFGDGQNDIEMLQLVGLGIAMANGPKHVQEIADDVTDTVDHDGVAKALKKYFDL